jgi:heptosyltransferase-2
VERFVIVAPNWLGDAVMALPAIADVRRGRPDAKVAVAARPSIASLFSLVRSVDDVIPLAGSGALEGFDTAILLPNSFHAALLAARAGVRERWGYRTDWRGFLLTRGIERPPAVHQIDYYQRLTASLGFSNGPSAPRIDVSDDLRSAGRDALRASGWDGRSPIVAVAPGAAFGSAKRWPGEAFADLIAGLADDGVSAAIVGAAADRAASIDLMHHLKNGVAVIDLVGRTHIPVLAGVLAECRALVANDSGALHLGAALGLNVTGIFGPTDERLTAPRASNENGRAAVVVNDTWCRPCGLRECPLDHACLRGVRPGDVLETARQMLSLGR